MRPRLLSTTGVARLLGRAGGFMPGATVALDFTSSRYRVGAGARYGRSFASLPGVTVTRSTGGYASAADGSLRWFPAGAARITDKGLRIEEARTNLARNSAAMNVGSVWLITSGAVNVSATPSVLPGQTAYDYIPGTAVGSTSNRIQMDNAVALTAQPYALTLIVSKKGHRYFNIRTNQFSTLANLINICVDLDQQTVAWNGSAGVASVSIRQLTASGAYTITVTGATPDAKNLATYLYAAPAAVLDNNAPAFTSDGVSGFTLHNVQLEAGTFGTSPIVTGAAAATRPADVVTLALTGMPQVYTALTDFETTAATPTTSGALYLNNGSVDESLRHNINAGTIQANSRSAAVTDGTLSLQAMLPSSRYRMVSSTAANNLRGTLNGVGILTDATVALPAAPTTMAIGVDQSAHYLNGWIRTVAIYPGQLPDASMQALVAGVDTSILNLNFAASSFKTTTPYVRTNVLPNSTLVNAQNGAVKTSTAIDAPDGSLTASRLDLSGVSATNDVATITGPILGSTTYTGSVWVRGAAGAVVTIFAKRTAGSIASSVGQAVTLTGQWQRITNQTFTSAADDTAGGVAVNKNVAVTLTAIDIWGGQLEPGSAASTSYIPTNGAAVSVATTQSPNLADIGALTFTNSTGGYAETQAGVLTWFPANTPRITDKGLLVEESRTNLCTNTNVNPADLTNTTLTNAPNGLATLAVVDDSAALAAIGLTGRVYKLDNSLGDGQAQASPQGGNSATATAHMISIYARGSGQLALSVAGEGNSNFANLTTYTRVTAAATPTVAGRRLTVRANAGQVVYFVLNQYELGAFATSPIPITGAAATRSADAASIAGVAAGAAWTMAGAFTIPSEDGIDIRPLTWSDGTGANRISFRRDTANAWGNIVQAANATVYSAAGAGRTGARTLRAATSHDGTSYRSAIDGLNSLATTAAAAPTGLNKLTIGGGWDGGSPVNGYVTGAYLYPYAANDNENLLRSAGNF